MSRAVTDRIVLVGMMGCGKTTVGELLAQRLGWAFHDNDVLLNQLFGATPRQLLASGGEPAMHSAELTALATALAMPTPSIVAAAGACVLDEGARLQLSDAGLVVWLRIDAAAVEARSAAGAHRPWPDEDRARWIADAIVERSHLYEEVADLVLDADRARPQALADRIVGELDSGRP